MKEFIYNAGEFCDIPAKYFSWYFGDGTEPFYYDELHTDTAILKFNKCYDADEYVLASAVFSWLLFAEQHNDNFEIRTCRKRDSLIETLITSFTDYNVLSRCTNTDLDKQRIVGLVQAWCQCHIKYGHLHGVYVQSFLNNVGA